MSFAILNGKIIERSEAKVDVEDRGYQFGDGVYEVIRVYNGKMFTLKEHLNRFEKSSESIGITLPYTMEDLTKLLEELIARNNLQLGTIYMQITRGVASRNHAFPVEKVTPSLVAYTKEALRPIESLKTGVRAILTEDIRWLRCDIKSLNLLGNLLAKQKAAEKSCFEAIQHRSEDVTEGSSSNIYIVKNGVVITHPSNHLILKGITKDVILKVCATSNIVVEERTYTLDELASADEVFLSSTTSEVMPIIEVNGKSVANGLPGAVTLKLQELFEREIEKQCGILKDKTLNH
jgi:D-alanine transaminase